jgi:hypothetical protein
MDKSVIAIFASIILSMPLISQSVIGKWYYEGGSGTTTTTTTSTSTTTNKLDESLCKSILSNYNPSILNLQYDEVDANRYLNFSKGNTATKWKINNRGNILVKSEFLPNIQFYQFRTFFVWVGGEFEGCGLHYIFFNETKRDFKNHLICSRGEEGFPPEAYIEYNTDKGYYMTAYEIIDIFDNSTKSTYHITVSNDPSDLRNILNLLGMYGCE